MGRSVKCTNCGSWNQVNSGDTRCPMCGMPYPAQRGHSLSEYPDFIVNGYTLVEYTGAGGDLILPPGIKEIGDEAFDGKRLITSVVIPEGVLSIGWCAFNECYNLKQVVLPSSLIEIDNEAFANCDLRRVIIPSKVTLIGACAFSECTKLEKIYIPQSVENIGTQAFEKCGKLTIYAEAPSRPNGWDHDPDGRGWNPDKCPVEWRTPLKKYEKLVKRLDKAIKKYSKK